MTSDAVQRLRLIRTPTIGPVTYRQLMARFGDATRALDALPDLARRGGRRLEISGAGAAEDELAALAQLGAVPVFLGTPAYPVLLAATETAPPMLAAKGRLAMLERPALAVVGARNASAAGVRLARLWSEGLSAAGLVIVSGLARGIDAAAHMGALETATADIGGTLAVVAGGIDVVYPPENAALMARIGEHGLVLAEAPVGTEPQARHFPRRNRIIAGLAAATLVVEAAPRSGSLITARLAAEFGRDVLAVPGSPLDPRAQGCNQLIREGATLVQRVDEVLEALSAFGGGNEGVGQRFQLAEAPAPMVSELASEAARVRVLSLLSPAPVAIDELVRQTGLAAADVASVLLDLELEGMMQRHAGGRVGLAA